jgi:hypothetical protein
MPCHIAGVDVHKKTLAVVVADVEIAGDYQFERLKIGTSPAQLRALADWFVEHAVEEVVMAGGGLRRRDESRTRTSCSPIRACTQRQSPPRRAFVQSVRSASTG